MFIKKLKFDFSKVVPLDYSGIITGRKVFIQDIEITNDFNPKTVNGIDIGVLALRIVTRSTEQDISGFYTFTQDIDASKYQGKIR